MCGVIGVYSPNNSVLRDAILSSEYISTRGSDSSGFAVPYKDEIKRVVGLGFFGDWPEEKRRKVDTFDTKEIDMVNIHLRYSTIGKDDEEFLLRNAQPMVINPEDEDAISDLGMAISHNGHIYSNHVKKRPKYETDIKQIAFPIYESLNDKKIKDELTRGVEKMIKQTKGCYSFSGFIYNRDEYEKIMFFGRDPLGIRPLYMAEINGGGLAVASEDIFLHNLEIGEERKKCKGIKKVPTGTLFMYDGKKIESIEINSKEERECAFEHVYFSSYGREGIIEERKSLGRQLWKESPVDADIVVPIPDSGKVHAQGLSEESGIPLVEALIRNRYKGPRSFILPNDEVRKKTIKRKITASSGMTGKKVILVDDSIIRGNTIKYVVNETKRVEPEEIHIRIGSPPVGFPCFLGIDMPSLDEFIYVKTAEKSGYDRFDKRIYTDQKIKNEIIEKIKDDLKVDSLAYLSYDGLKKVLGENHCFGCWNPDGYPEIFRDDVLRLAGYP